MNSSKQKILLFGPIGDFGGRELEIGFIASVLSLRYDTAICSTGIVTGKSQVFDFNKEQKVFQLKVILSKKFTALKLLAMFSFFKNGCKGRVSDFVNNALSKRYFDYDNKIKIVLDDLITNYDAVFIVAQLSSSLVNDVIQIAKNKNKKVFFRTTGTITFSEYDFIDSVDCFIHHSVRNANQIENRKHKYEIIDQCAYNETDLLSVSPSKREIHNFLILSRLSEEKGIENAIDFFLKSCSEGDVLYVAGNGPLENSLKNKYKESNNIKFTGFIDRFQLSRLFESVDSLIICSPEESGPLVGIEAMAAGKIIISTKVGAMGERLENTLNQFWFNYNDLWSFKETFAIVKLLNKEQIESVSLSIREKYSKEYSVNQISKKYLNIVNQGLSKYL